MRYIAYKGLRLYEYEKLSVFNSLLPFFSQKFIYLWTMSNWLAYLEVELPISVQNMEICIKTEGKIYSILFDL